MNLNLNIFFYWFVSMFCLVGIGEPYQAPYHGMVSGNPSIDELRKVVCVEKKRPPILNRWHDDHVSYLMFKIYLLILLFMYYLFAICLFVCVFVCPG